MTAGVQRAGEPGQPRLVTDTSMARPWVGPACRRAGIPENPKLPAADGMLALMQDNYRLGRTRKNELMAVDQWRMPGVAIPMRGTRGLRQRLNADYVRLTSRGATEAALSQAISVAEGMASCGELMPRPRHRLAFSDGVTYLDLGWPDGRCAAMWPGGWKMAAEPGRALFARSALTGQLPMPACGEGEASLEVVRRLINIPDPDDWALWLACRVASLMPGIAHPIEIFTGRAGSGKTMAMQITMDMMCPGVLLDQPRDAQQHSQMAMNCYVLPFDNISSIPSWWAEPLCRSVTGGSLVTRQLYTEADLFMAEFTNVVLINGITLPALRGDLNDRGVTHRLVPPAGGWLPKTAIEALWEREWPRALAWLLDYTCRVWAYMGRVPQDGSWARMTEFAQVVRAVDALAGTHAEAKWRDRRWEAAQDLVNDHPLSVAVTKAIREKFTGTSGELLDWLTMHGGLLQLGRQGTWSPTSVGIALDRVEISLSAVGWRITKHRDGRTRRRLITIEPPGTWA